MRFSPKIRNGRNRSPAVTSAITAMVKTACNLFMGFPPSRFPHNGKHYGNDHHGGDQEDISAENQQADHGGNHADDSGQVIFGAEPLFHKDRDEQSGENEFNTLVVDGQQGTGQTAQDGAGHPIDLVEQGHQEAIGVAVHALRRLILGNERVGFVRQGKDHVRLFLAGSFVRIHHRDAVKQVPGVYQKGSHSGSQQPCPGGKQADGHILHGTGINKQTHCRGPDNAIAALVQQDAEAEAQKHIPGKYGDGVQKSGADGVLFHRYPLSFFGKLRCTGGFLPAGNLNGGNRRIGGKALQKFLTPFFALNAADIRLEKDAVGAAGELFCAHVLQSGAAFLRVSVDGGQSIGNVRDFHAVKMQADIRADQLMLENFQNGQGDENEHHPRQCHGIIPAAGSDPEAGHSPKAGSGGQTLHVAALPQNGTGAEKTDAGDDLSAEPGGVGGSAEGIILGKDHLSGDHHGAGPQRHQNMGAHPSRAVGIFPFRTDNQTHDHSAKQPQADLPQRKLQSCRPRPGGDGQKVHKNTSERCFV